jgi:hypothetical protein
LLFSCPNCSKTIMLTLTIRPLGIIDITKCT